MQDRPLNLPPQNAILRWIAEIGDDLPSEIQERLRAVFFVSRAPLVAGALNSVAVAFMAYLRSGNLLFAAIAICDLLLLGVRLRLVKRTSAPSGPLFLSGLLWSGLQGATIALVVLSEDLALSLLVLASGLAAIGGIIGRNFAAPRYAMIQTLILDLSFKLTFALHVPEFLPIIAVQSVVFVLMNLTIIRHHREAAIKAIQGEIESREKAIQDPLTGIGNRRALEEAFDRMTSPMVDRVLLYLDLDGFKQVNDRLGHGAGDELLKQVGRRLSETVGRDVTVCRLGGDEFLVLAERLDGPAVRALGARIIAAIAAPYEIGSGVLARVGASVGAVARDRETATLADLMLKADRALYAAKASGKGCCVLHAQTTAPDRSRAEPRPRAAG